MRKCSKCSFEKQESEFNKNSRRKDGLQTICKECNRTKLKDWYADNKHKQIKKSLNRRSCLKEQLDTIKRVLGCMQCKNESEPCCLDFHHVDARQKIKSIAAARQSMSIQRLQEEIDKCVLLCANCHRKIENGVNQLDATYIGCIKIELTQVEEWLKNYR